MRAAASKSAACDLRQFRSSASGPHALEPSCHEIEPHQGRLRTLYKL